MKSLFFVVIFLASCLAAQQSLAFQPSFFGADRETVSLRSSSVKSVTRSASYSKRSQGLRLRSTTSGDPQSQIDADALLKYSSAAVVQMAVFWIALSAFDTAVDASGIHPPFWVTGLFFYACSLKSRVLNPLSNERPDVGSPVASGIERPSWFPPGIIFPIMWILIIGPVRAYTSAMVYDVTGEFLNFATLSFLLHLTIGDIWNTINNVEKRLGAAASGVALVIISAANASYQYYQVDTTAGKLLGLTLLWLCTAAALVTSIWSLNPNPTTGLKDAPYPVKGDVETRFSWFNTSE